MLKQVKLFTPRYAVTTCGYGPAPEGVTEHVRIPDELVYWRLNRPLTVLRRFDRVYRTQEVVRFAANRLPVGRFDVVLANDVEAVPLALSLNPRRGFHADLHEYSPRQKEDVRRWRLFVAPYMRWLVRTHVTHADSVTTVCDGLADAYRDEFGIEARVVTNASPYRDARPSPTGMPLRIVHSGAAMPDRHLEVLIDAAARTRQDVTFDLYLARNDPGYIARLREHADQVAPGRVRVLDPVPYRELIDTLARYDIGFYSIPPVSFNHLHSLPNKFFDFVQARLALVVSPSPEMARLVDRHGLGLVAQGFEAEDLARCLDDLTVERVEKFKRASAAAAPELSAENQVEGWARAVDALMARAPRQEDR